MKAPKLSPAVERLAYRPADAAIAADIGRAKLYELIRSGRLKARKLDGATVILRADLERFLADLPAVEVDRDEVAS